MLATEICPLNQKVLAKLLAERTAVERHTHSNGRRQTIRWPFPGTVELWAPEGSGREWYALATSVNLSVNGIGLRCDEALEPGDELEIAVHEPEMSLHGRGVVRHCTELQSDSYLVGMQFLFDAK